MGRRATVLDYIKAAFFWHWNLLGVAGGVGIALLSGRLDMVLPLVAAAEIGYLGLLSTHPRFRKSVDARLAGQDADSRRQEELKRIMSSLPKTELKRFETLRDHCVGLNRLGQQFRNSGMDQGRLDDMHVASLDRLLWVFLKLLYSKDAVNRFLATINRKTLMQELDRTEKSLEKARQDGRENLSRSYEDKMATIRQRLQNFDASVRNRELIEAELERIEQKMTAVSELSLSSQDPAAISSHIDGISESISITTEAIRSFDVVPAIEYDDVPEFLREESD